MSQSFQNVPKTAFTWELSPLAGALGPALSGKNLLLPLFYKA